MKKKDTKIDDTNIGEIGLSRRAFLHASALGAISLTGLARPTPSPETPMGIVVHSYGFRWNSPVKSQKYPGFVDAIDLIRHCSSIGAGGVQVVVKGWTPDFTRKVRTVRENVGLYLEGSIGVPVNKQDVARFEREVKNAREAGATVLRTVCSAGRRYETYHTMEEFRQLQKNALESLQLALPVLQQEKIKLAVENHKDWRATELVAMLKQLDSEWVGVTLDFGNSISLLEDPMEVVNALGPYVHSTHVKDMALEEYPDGFLLSEVPLGNGILDLPRMIETCKKSNPNVSFNLEMITRDPLAIPCLKKTYWETFPDLPGTALAATLRTVRDSKNMAPLPRISALSAEEKLGAEEQNILKCLQYSKSRLGFR
jgi:sugar phosphate isomerase/epimerase